MASTRPIARHIINDRDHAACVLLVSYCGPAYVRQTKTALIAYGRSDLGGRCEARIDLERVDGRIYLRAASTFAHATTTIGPTPFKPAAIPSVRRQLAETARRNYAHKLSYAHRFCNNMYEICTRESATPAFPFNLVARRIKVNSVDGIYARNDLTTAGYAYTRTYAYTGGMYM